MNGNLISNLTVLLRDPGVDAALLDHVHDEPLGLDGRAQADLVGQLDEGEREEGLGQPLDVRLGLRLHHLAHQPHVLVLHEHVRVLVHRGLHGKEIKGFNTVHYGDDHPREAKINEGYENE